MLLRILLMALIWTATVWSLAAQIIDLEDTSLFSEFALHVSFDPSKSLVSIRGRNEVLGVEFFGAGPGLPREHFIFNPLLTPVGDFTLLNIPPDGQTSTGLALIIQFREPVRRVGMDLGNGSPMTIAEVRALAPGGRLLGSVQRQDIDPKTGTFVGLETSDPEGILTVIVDYGDDPKPEQIAKLIFEPFENEPFVTYIPHVGDGKSGDLRLSTTIELMTLTNVDSLRRPLDVATVSFFDSAGQPLEITINGQKQSVFEVPLNAQAGGLHSLESSGGTDDLVVGYARIESTFPLQASAIFRTSGENGLIAEAGISGTPSRVRHFLPARFDPETRVETALAIVNLGDETDSIVLCLPPNPPDGPDFIPCKNVEMEPGTHRAFFLREEFPDIGESFFLGTVRVTADRRIVATALRTIDGIAFASLPSASLKR